MLRSALGPGMRIRVDANEGYRSASEAMRITKATEPYDIAFTDNIKDMFNPFGQPDLLLMAHLPGYAAQMGAREESELPVCRTIITRGRVVIDALRRQ